MIRRQFAPAARRRGDRIRLSSIGAMLGALVTLAAEHRTQAQDTPRVSWIFPGASAPNPSKRGRKRTCATSATLRAETSARIAAAKSVRRVGQAAGAKCPQKNLQNFILRFSTGFEPR